MIPVLTCILAGCMDQLPAIYKWCYRYQLRMGLYITLFHQNSKPATLEDPLDIFLHLNLFIHIPLKLFIWNPLLLSSGVLLRYDFYLLSDNIKKGILAQSYIDEMGKMISLRPLGRTGILISPIGLGCWQFSKQKNMAGKFWPALEDDLIEKVVAISIEGGINWFDTAELYGSGASEKALSKALQVAGKKPGDVVIATKWWPALRFASNISKTINKRISTLDPYPIDLYQVHQPFSFSSENSEMEVMAELFNRKLIRAVGVSNFNAKKMENSWETLQKSGIPLASNQVRYSLLDRKIESNGVMELSKKLGITIIAYSPLAQGLVTGKFHDNPELPKNDWI